MGIRYGDILLFLYSTVLTSTERSRDSNTLLRQRHRSRRWCLGGSLHGRTLGTITRLALTDAVPSIGPSPVVGTNLFGAGRHIILVVMGPNIHAGFRRLQNRLGSAQASQKQHSSNLHNSNINQSINQQSFRVLLAIVVVSVTLLATTRKEGEASFSWWRLVGTKPPRPRRRSYQYYGSGNTAVSEQQGVDFFLANT